MMWFATLVVASLLWCHCAGVQPTPQPTSGPMISTRTTNGQTCEILEKISGEIYDNRVYGYGYTKCWLKQVPQDSYIRLSVTELSFNDYLCTSQYVNIFVSGVNETYKVCHSYSNIQNPVIALNDVKITFVTNNGFSGAFRMKYTTGNVICAQKNHFKCSPNFCIHENQVCNGVKDCENGSDEVGCENIICAEKDHFRCSPNFCIHKYQVCDGVEDCENGSDEVGCENIICAEKDHFRCSKYFCIHKYQVCDGVEDCENGSDEVGCENIICAEKDHFRCSKYFCIHEYQVCDGVKDCENGSDEVGCENIICAEKDHFRCSPNFCIHKYQVCDGVKDCENGSDEVGCENIICAEKDHFRCSPNFCIHEYQVCDGVEDCENGSDEVGCEEGIVAVKGMKVSRINAINWLKNQRTQSFDWGKNTHRAITALYLSKAMTFQGDDLEEELIAKQLELLTSVALLRNESDPISISELSMFVNALTVTCHDPQHFHGYNLVQILSDRVASAKSPVPSAYLTLCNLNWTISVSEIENLVTLLNKDSKYPFYLDVKALTIMAMTCIKNKTEHFRDLSSNKNTYKSAVQNSMSQHPDGSFGNVYTTALVTQALIASGEEHATYWNATAAALYLMKQLNSSSVDFLSVYLALPVFSGKSLVDIKAPDCSNKTRKEGKEGKEDKEISEVIDKLGEKTHIQYSLYIGDQKDVVHTIYLRMPGISSAFDVMRMAQAADPKYKFLEIEVSNQKYIYEIAGITNDPEAGKFWLLYIGDHYLNGTVEHHILSPDKVILGANDHLIMWYRTVYI